MISITTTPTEIQFGSTDQGNSLVVESQDDGQLCVSVPEDEAHHHLSLQQTIQLRDFLNRHIDSLALGSIGASTERSSDDPAQLPAEHAVDPDGHGVTWGDDFGNDLEP